MAKDRYSDDHTIEIVGDTKTLTVKDNLSVEENLDVGGDANIAGDLVADTLTTASGNLDVPGDLLVGGDIDSAGSITADSYSYNEPKSTFKWVPTSHLQAIALQTTAGGTPTPSTSGTDTAVSFNGSALLNDYPTLLVGHTTDPGWDLYIQIDPFIPDQAALSGITFLVDMFVATGTPVGGYEYRVNVESLDDQGASVSWNTVATATAFGPTLPNLRENIEFSFTPVTISTGDGTGAGALSRIYRVKFSCIEPIQACVIAILRMGLRYNVSSVDQAINLE